MNSHRECYQEAIKANAQFNQILSLKLRIFKKQLPKVNSTGSHKDAQLPSRSPEVLTEKPVN